MLAAPAPARHIRRHAHATRAATASTGSSVRYVTGLHAAPGTLSAERASPARSFDRGDGALVALVTALSELAVQRSDQRGADRPVWIGIAAPRHRSRRSNRPLRTTTAGSTIPSAFSSRAPTRSPASTRAPGRRISAPRARVPCVGWDLHGRRGEHRWRLVPTELRRDRAAQARGGGSPCDRRAGADMGAFRRPAEVARVPRGNRRDSIGAAGLLTPTPDSRTRSATATSSRSSTRPGIVPRARPARFPRRRRCSRRRPARGSRRPHFSLGARLSGRATTTSSFCVASARS